MGISDHPTTEVIVINYPIRYRFYIDEHPEPIYNGMHDEVVVEVYGDYPGLKDHMKAALQEFFEGGKVTEEEEWNE